MRRGDESGDIDRFFCILFAIIIVLMLLGGCTDEAAPCTFLASEDIDRAYNETQRCMVMHAPLASSVEYQSFSHFGLPPAEGLYIPSARAVWINGDLQLSCKRQEVVLEHEYVHHILRENGLEVESSTHDHPSWGTCGAIIGEPE